MVRSVRLAHRALFLNIGVCPEDGENGDGDVMVIMEMVMMMTKMAIMPEGATAGAQLLGREGVQ